MLPDVTPRHVIKHVLIVLASVILGYVGGLIASFASWPFGMVRGVALTDER